MKKFAVFNEDNNSFMFFVFADYWCKYDDYHFLVFFRNNEVYSYAPGAYCKEVEYYG